jgi:hypothetical protein
LGFGTDQERVIEPKQQTQRGYGDKNTPLTMMCHTIPSQTGGTVTLLFAFAAHANPYCTMEQQNMMEKAIFCMDNMCMMLTATSIAEQALQQVSRTKIPIKCFGCDGIQEYEKDSYHLKFLVVI